METAKIQNIIKTSNSYLIAARNFKTSYGYLPGDHPNMGTYPGDGDGNIWYRGSCPQSCYEGVTFFEHLSITGNLSQKYIFDINAVYPQAPLVGVNIPLDKDRGTFIAGNAHLLSNSCLTYAGGPTNPQFLNINLTDSWLFYAYAKPPATTYAQWDFISTGVEWDKAKSIDLKIDDGQPYTGNVIGATSTFIEYCPNMTTAPYADYTKLMKYSMGFKINE